MLNKLTGPKYTIIMDSKSDETAGITKSPGGGLPGRLTHKKIKIDVHPDRYDVAQKIDTDGDFKINYKDIKKFLQKNDILRDPSRYSVNEDHIVESFTQTLEKKEIPLRDIYHSYDEVITELKDLEKKYPDLAKTVSLGKTAEGRDIMAIKISKGVNGDTSGKPGFLITGCHHAREWSSMEAPLNISKELLENYAKDEGAKKKVDSAEIWIVPIANPDGYEYSRNEYAFWRKNREPIHASDLPSQIAQDMTPDKDGVVAYGVDLNRNYYDGNSEHMELYRPKGDTAESTNDDFGWATSDNPEQETYRGPKGASEKEVQAIMGLWLKNKNIKGIVNHHNYGKKILYPWGVTQKESPNKKTYLEIINKMVGSIKDDRYVAEQSGSFYPASGDPDDFASVNGKLSFTIEVGNEFQPGKNELEHVKKDMYNANMAFLDWIIEHQNELKDEKKSEDIVFTPNIPKNLFDDIK